MRCVTQWSRYYVQLMLCVFTGATPSDTHQIPVYQDAHVSRALGLMGSRERWSKRAGGDTIQPSQIHPWSHTGGRCSEIPNTYGGADGTRTRNLSHHSVGKSASYVGGRCLNREPPGNPSLFTQKISGQHLGNKFLTSHSNSRCHAMPAGDRPNRLPPRLFHIRSVDLQLEATLIWERLRVEVA